jgi:hypothetical protein
VKKETSSKVGRYLAKLLKGLVLVVFIAAITLAILWGAGATGTPQEVTEQVRSAIQDIQASAWMSLLAVAAVVAAYRPVNRYAQVRVYESSGGLAQVAYGVVLASVVAVAYFIIKDDVLMWGIATAAIATLGWLVYTWRTTNIYYLDDAVPDDEPTADEWIGDVAGTGDETVTDAASPSLPDPDATVSTEPGEIAKLRSMMQEQA